MDDRGEARYAQVYFHDGDVYAIIDQQDLEWIRNNQGNLRREVLHGLTDHLKTNDADPHAVGQKVILPSSYHAGNRAMQQAFQNACALRRQYGAISLFVTFTANPKWPEIMDCIACTVMATRWTGRTLWRGFST